MSFSLRAPSYLRYEPFEIMADHNFKLGQGKAFKFLLDDDGSLLFAEMRSAEDNFLYDITEPIRKNSKLLKRLRDHMLHEIAIKKNEEEQGAGA
jgi:hypothetical protein